MKILVTGATGFVGRHVVFKLLERGYEVIATARDNRNALERSWFNRVNFIECDIHLDFQRLIDANPDVLIHLAWAGLPNYRSLYHLQRNLPADLIFLEKCVNAGFKHVMVAGTCLEYGVQYGPLDENQQTQPTTPYGMAKDSIRKSMQLLQQHSPFIFQWVRLFYMYGEGQNPSSLLSQLNMAIESGATSFNMSNGDQLRDYLPIEKIANYFVELLEKPEIQGVINCCSGKPISILDLVQQYCNNRGSEIKLNRGYYDYPDYESLAFWGVPSSLNRLENKIIIEN